jgi:hypothetical protein
MKRKHCQPSSMRPRAGSISWPRVILSGIISAALAFAFFGFAGDGANTAKAAVACCDCYYCDWLSFTHYQSISGITFPGTPGPTTLTNLQLTGPNNKAGTAPPPAAGASTQVDSLVDIVANVSRSGAPSDHIDEVVDVTLNISNPNSPGGTSLPYDLEILQLAVKGMPTGISGPPPLSLRESPTLASTGQYSVTPIAGSDKFNVTSFFDVFTELSLDGGATYYPAAASMRLALTSIVPEPGSIVLAVVGLGGVGIICRRSRIRA